MGRVYTDAEREHAQELARALKQKIELYFPEPPEDARINEVTALKRELEDMGLHVTWSLSLDPSTLRCSCVVELWVPKEIH